jgi:hypothetical protein
MNCMQKADDSSATTDRNDPATSASISPAAGDTAPTAGLPEPSTSRVSSIDGDERLLVKDTRLNAAMRALLAIIAGLIVGDMLKGTVATITVGAATRADAWANAWVFLGATVFILRVLTDNVLYYNDPDAVTKDEAYGLRVLLIGCDLVSYALCYGVVARLADNTISVIRREDVAWTIALFFWVETLHFAWCSIALAALRDEPDTDTRKPLLVVWRRLSGTWAVAWFVGTLGLVIIATLTSASRGLALGVAAFVLLLSMGSAWHYLHRLRPHYMGRAITVIR